MLNEITKIESKSKSIREKVIGKWSCMSLYRNGDVKDHAQYDSWYINKDLKVSILHKPSYNEEKKNWEEKETLYELSEDGKTLKAVDEGPDATLVEEFSSISLSGADYAGAVITMHEYLAKKRIN